MALDLENERKYLQGRMSMSQNNPGLADWVQSRSKELGISLQAPSAGAQPGTASGGAPNNYMADFAQAYQAYKASGLLGNRGNVSVTPYTPRPTNIPNRQQLTTQAQGEVNPWVQRQTESTNRLYEDLRKRLPALLNARGQVTGGLRTAQEKSLTERQDIAVGDVNLQAQERVAQLVNALQQRAEENAYRQQQSDYQQYLGGQQLGLQAETMNQQGQQNELANLLGFAKFGRGVTESDRSFGLAERQALFGEQFAEKEFAYKQARDSIADERYKEEFDFNVKKWGLEVALDEAYKSGQLDISRTNAETSQGQLQETIRSNKADEASAKAKLDFQAKESEAKQPDVADTMKNSLLQKIATDGIESLTRNEIAVAPSLGVRLTQPEDKISQSETNNALSLFTTWTDDQQKKMLGDAEFMQDLASSGVDINKLWEAYFSKKQGENSRGGFFGFMGF